MRRALTAVLLTTLLAVLVGCGSSGSSSNATEVAERQAEAVKATAEANRAAEAAAPKGASPTLRAIYGSFQPPQTSSMEPAAAKAVKGGEAACKGKTPTEVKEEFYPDAEKFLEPQQAKMIGQIASFEKQANTDRSFVAGQLAADTYAATLPAEAEEQPGYQGCVYALAQQLERQLAPSAQKK
jgi:hypothetical protein